MITVSAFKWVPPFARGVVRDLRVRWALEEAGLPYKTQRLGQGEQKSPAYRQSQPFGQVPTFEENGLCLFESGAIVLHVAERSETLLPKDELGRARAMQWLFAALNTIEFPVMQLAGIDLFYADQPWAKERRPGAEEAVAVRFGELSTALGEREYLDERFTAADLLMSTVLRILHYRPFVERFPTLLAYQRRCESRPAFKKALQAQLDDFEAR